MYCYVVVNADAQNGITPSSPAACIDDEPTLSFLGVNNTLSLPARYTYPLGVQLWYVSQDGGPYQLLDVGVGKDMGQRQDSRGGWPQTLPSGSLDISKNEDLFTSVQSVQGNTITLNDPLLSNVSSTLVDHDDSDAIQRALNAADTSGGGIIQFGSGQYNIRRPQFGTRDRTATTNYSLALSNSRWSYFHIASQGKGNIYLEGQGRSTILQTPPDDGANGVVMSIGNLGTTALDTPGWSHYPLLKILDASIGSSSLTLTSSSEESYVSPGSNIWVYSGNSSPVESACTDNDGTAGGSCHFSEFNMVTSVNGRQLTLAYPLSKDYYDDGRDSFGIVILPSLIHNIAIKDLTIATYDPVLYGSLVMNLLVDNVTIHGVVSENPFGGGYKRNMLIENSSWSLGESDVAWHGTDEYDQSADVAFVNDKITGYAAPGVEGSSGMARIYMTEGSSGFIFEGNVFNHVSILSHDSADDIIRQNLFIDGAVKIADGYDPYTHPFLFAGLDDEDVISFGSHGNISIDDNEFDISEGFSPPWVINVGHFQSSFISSNTIKYDMANNVWPIALIMSNGGKISNNVITMTGQDKAVTAIALIPDQGPGLEPSSFDVYGNTISAISMDNGIYAVDAGFTNSAPICIGRNVIQSNTGVSVNISSADRASLGCN